LKRAWDQVKFRVSSWVGEPPVPGDEMTTHTGRRYQILEVKPKALVCLVLPAEAPVQGRVFMWEWDKRKRK
jgi:hypothetical protein